MRPPEFWSRNDLISRTVACALSPVGLLYGASVAWKHRWQTSYRSRAAVVCVGNLTVGGSGKTPVAIAIARMFRAQGIAVIFILRGYGRRSTETILVDAQKHAAAAVGDEALLLAEIAPTIVARDRAEGARLAEREGAEVIIMDDGHQNFALAKDLSLIVVDGETGLSNGRLIPAGPLREPARQGLDRADAVIVMGEGSPPLPDFARPVIRARLLSDNRLDGRPVVAFAGMGRPDKFFASLRTQGANLVETHRFADHHAYSAAEIATLRRRATSTGAALMTTEKDFVRLNANDRAGIDVLPVKAVFGDPAAIERLFAPVLKGLK
ncbi:MAG TPA: tetraacyldisaccharide 4'-kinase [Rhizomicrobium sp.]|jgi:tetraacyldisaccharide 4'-kinase|nr:tetraacyldisaccharide 4'-kinase [Rhizomicrobium sp.]